ncbi:hypothetical protein HDU98_011196, partial [Podochytrium sp. JEL0797]
EINEDWIKKIKHQKFQWHNSEYLTVMSDLLEQQEEEAAAAAAAAHQQQKQQQKSRKPSGLGNAVSGSLSSAPRKVAIGNAVYYSGLDNDTDSDEEEFARQIGGTSAILDGP